MKKRLLICTLVLIFLLDLIFGWRWWQKWKEDRFDSIIALTANRYKVDPCLIKAIIWRESRFNYDAIGSAGEIGLMQIKPITAKEWAEKELKNNLNLQSLRKPDINIRVGTWYLCKLLSRYKDTDNPPMFALADYNAGRTKTLKWLKGEAKTNGQAFFNSIEFPMTKAYVKNILERADYYKARGYFKNYYQGTNNISESVQE